MAGFFKKLFNRIVGKKDDEPPIEHVALPAPIAEPETDLEIEIVADTDLPRPAIEGPVATVPKAKAKTKAPKIIEKPAAKPAAKKPEPAKPVAKKNAAKPAIKPSPQKAAARKTGSVKPEAKKAVSKVVGKKIATPSKIAPIAKPLPPQPSLPPPKPEPVVAKVKPEPVSAPAVVPRLPIQPKPIIVPAAPAPEPEKKGWFSRLKEGLAKSSKSIAGSITTIFTKRKLDAITLQELEDTLIQADLGIAVAERIIKSVSIGRFDKEIDPEEVKQILADEVAKVLKPVEVPFNFGTEKPFVILVVGVNGSGKTTTIGKLGSIAANEGFKVKFAACDTFRAAAIEQLTVWGQRIGAETISRPPGSDAAGLAYDAMKASQADGTDILFVDTAGRLHNKTYLMDELDKVVRVIQKYDAKAPHAVLLVLDATTGQNALAQAEAFTKVAGVTGLIMTKLDGTARGGILVAIAEKFRLPIHAVGVGETLEDLQPFDADAFARAIAGLEEQ